MRIHLIAIGGAVMHNMAMAMQEKGFEVSAVVPVRSLEDYFLKITEGGAK